MIIRNGAPVDNARASDHGKEYPPDVTSWSIPSTEMVALAIGLPWRSRTNPLTPRCICEGQEQSKNSHQK